MDNSELGRRITQLIGHQGGEYVLGICTDQFLWRGRVMAGKEGYCMVWEHLPQFFCDHDRKPINKNGKIFGGTLRDDDTLDGF